MPCVFVFSQAGQYFLPLQQRNTIHLTSFCNKTTNQAPSSWLCRQMVGLPCISAE